MKKTMKPIDWFVYRLLRDKTLGNDEAVSQKEIHDACVEAGFDLSWNETQNQHHDHCRQLHDIVERINSSMEVDKVVIHRAYRYRLANAEEAYELYKQFDNRIKCASIRRKAIAMKMARDGQGKLLSNQLSQIDHDDPTAKIFHEAYNDIAEMMEGKDVGE